MDNKINVLFFILVVFIGCKKDILPPEQITKDLEVIVNVKPPNSYGAADGEINIEITGGVEPYNITLVKDNPWVYDTISYSEDLINIKSGMYFLTIIDSADNLYSESIFVSSKDTIFPKEYLPVYPGSYWEYDDGSIETVGNNYEKVGVFNYLRTPPPWWQGHGNPYWPNDSIYVPVWNGNPILEYDRINTDEYYIPLIPIINENIFEKTVLEQDHRIWGTVIMTVAVDTVILVGETIFNDVIVTLQGWGFINDFDQFPENFTGLKKKYYAKEIGLIRFDETAWNDNTFKIVKQIVNWEINYNN